MRSLFIVTVGLLIGVADAWSANESLGVGSFDRRCAPFLGQR